MWKINIDLIKSIEDVPGGAYGFIYMMTNKATGKFYIGRKNLYFERTKHLGKKELEARIDKRQSKKKKVIKESDWLNYNSSNEQILLEIEQGELFYKEIIEFCYSKKQLTYYEVYYQFKYDVLRENSYNSNILGKFYRKDI